MDPHIFSFNPCFSGCGSAIRGYPKIPAAPDLSFNPCFSGCGSAIFVVTFPTTVSKTVSILVLVDVALQSKGFELFNGKCWFQSLF